MRTALWVLFFVLKEIPCSAGGLGTNPQGGLASNVNPTNPVPAADFSNGMLIYQGAFKVPATGDGHGFYYNGGQMTYCPATTAADSAVNDGYPGSLWLGGQDDGYGRITIPAPTYSATVNGILNTATMIVDPDTASFAGDRYARPLDGPPTFCSCHGTQERRGGCTWLPAISPQTEPHLYGAVYYYYPQCACDTETFMSISETMSPASRSNFWHMGPHQTPPSSYCVDWSPMNHSHYQFLIPTDWATTTRTTDNWR